jgi:hypothetical protein
MGRGVGLEPGVQGVEDVSEPVAPGRGVHFRDQVGESLPHGQGADAAGGCDDELVGPLPAREHERGVDLLEPGRPHMVQAQPGVGAQVPPGVELAQEGVVLQREPRRRGDGPGMATGALGAELREELARLGVVVREEGGRQYWRPVRNGSPSEG